MECLLSEHKECITEVITIEEASRHTNPLWNEILTKCESYKLIYERQKSRKDENFRNVEAVDKELRVTISQMRLEMIRRINLICKNALELSVSVMAQRASVAKADVDNLGKAMEKINAIQSAAEKKNQLIEEDHDFISNLEDAKREVAVIEKLFEDIKQSKNEVLIQFVVPPIVTDFMEHFHSLGEIVEEVKEEGRTSVYISDTERRDIHRRKHVERSQNPFKTVKMNVDNPALTVEDNQKEDELFIFQKGIYNQDDRNLYAYIDVQRLTEPSETSAPTSPTKRNSCIPPLPAKPSSCRKTKTYETSSVDESIRSFYESESREAEEDVILRDNKTAADDRPKPKPRTSIGKNPKPPEPSAESHSKFDNGTDLPENSNELYLLKSKLMKSYSHPSTYSDESYTSSRGDKTDSGIIVQLDDQANLNSPSSASASPCQTPVFGRRQMYRLFPGSDFRSSDTDLNSKETKRYVRTQPTLQPSTSTGHFPVLPRHRRDIPGNNTYPTSCYDFQPVNQGSESNIDASTALEEFDRIIANVGSEEPAEIILPEESVAPSILDSNRPSCAQKPPAALSMIELQSHKKDNKDVCIITSIVVTKNQLIVVCDYSHNCMQLYDRLGNRKQVYGLAKPFGSCLLSENKIAVTSRTRSSVNIFYIDEGLLKFEKEHRLGNLVSVFGLTYSNGYICVCCLTNLAVFTEDLQPYSSVKAITSLEPKGTLKRRKSAKPVFSSVKYCAMDFTDAHNEIFVSDFSQDRVLCITIDGEVKWKQTIKAPKSVALHQGKVYVAAKKEIVIIEAGRGLIIREVHERVPKYPWSLFVDDVTSTMFITNGSINDAESRKIESLPLKILTTILG